MKIVIDISHPGHVHFFKNFIWEMEKKGHEILITATKKEITYDLLDHYDFKYERLGDHKKSLIKKIMNIPIIDLKMYNIVKKFNPDFFLGLSSFRAAQVSFLLRKKCIIFDDTEHSSQEIMLYLPFTNKVMTPSCFRKNLGPKQIRYNGYHELAYLHPNWFKPDPTILDDLAIDKGEKFVIIRFVSWFASHDIGEKGIKEIIKSKIIKELSNYATPIITSEGGLPLELKQFQLTIPPHRIHHALYYASMYIGEGATMASEAAILGTPAIYINSLKLGYIDEEEKYGLINQYDELNNNLEQVLEKIKTILKINKESWQEKREKLLKAKIDVTSFIIQFIENYPGSKKSFKKK